MSLSQQKTETHEITVQYVKHPENYTLVNQPPSSLFLSISASGYDLQSLNRDKKGNFTLDVSMMNLQHVGNQYHSVFRTDDFSAKIMSQLELDGKIDQIKPDTITLIYEKNISKAITVSLDVDYQLSQQFWLSSNPVISPKIITVEGLPIDLDSLTEIKTVYQNFDVLSDTLRVKLALVQPTTKYPVSLSSDSVELMIPVEEFTEKTFSIPVFAQSMDNSFKVKTFPDNISVSCLVSLHHFNQIVDTMFEAQVVYDKAVDKEKDRLPVQIVNRSGFARISKIEPEKVEFILIKQ